jgi:hypothetical protein
MAYNTLYDYYTQQGKALPSWNSPERISLAAQAGITSGYTGTPEQNNQIVAFLNKQSTTPATPTTPTTPTIPITPITTTTTPQEQLSAAQTQLADLQAQQKALEQSGLTDTNQLTKDTSGNYVPTSTLPYDTGNEDLNTMLKSFQDTLNSTIGSGKIVNPNINITPELTKQWADQASQELDPYYQSQFQAVKSDLSTDLNYLSDQYNQTVKSQQEQFKQNLATQRESEAGAGTIFSGGRLTREQELAKANERNIESLGTTLGYQAQKQGTTAERSIGSLGLSGLTSPTYASQSVSTLNQGDYIPLQERNLFTPTGGIVGSLEREQIEKKRAYSDLLKQYWLEEQTV